MDDLLRRLERRARAGDLDAALAWLQAADRIGNYDAQLQALLAICEIQAPEGYKTATNLIDEIDQIKSSLRGHLKSPMRIIHYSSTITV